MSENWEYYRNNEGMWAWRKPLKAKLNQEALADLDRMYGDPSAIIEVNKLLAEITALKTNLMIRINEANVLLENNKQLRMENDGLRVQNGRFSRQVRLLNQEVAQSYGIRVPVTEETKRLNAIITNLKNSLLRLGVEAKLEDKSGESCITTSITVSKLIMEEMKVDRDELCRILGYKVSKIMREYFDAKNNI